MLLNSSERAGGKNLHNGQPRGREVGLSDIVGEDSVLIHEEGWATMGGGTGMCEDMLKG